jgi:chromosome partitioning protein
LELSWQSGKLATRQAGVPARRQKMHTIAVLNQKGGVGKTTLSCNLAAAAHLSGQRSIVLDMDPQGTALDWYAARQPGSPLEGLAVAKVDTVLDRNKLTALTCGYDVAILDGPARLGELTRSAAIAADLVVIPMQPGYFDMWASDKTLSVLDDADRIRAHLGFPPVARRFVLNFVKTGTRIAAQAPSALAQLGELVDVRIHHRTVFVLASGLGEGVLSYEPTSRAATEIQALYDELMATAAGKPACRLAS